MRPLLFRLAAFLLGCLVALLLLEAWLRVSPPGWVASRNWPVDRRDGRPVGFLPNTAFEALHFEYRHAVTIDERGARTTRPCAPGQAPIPFVGDSYVFGLGVEDHETFVSLLAEALDLCFLNLGIPGASASDERHLIRRRHAELGSPPVVLVGVFSNDLEVSRRENPIVGDNLSWLLRKSYAIQFLRIETASMRQRVRRRLGPGQGFYTRMMEPRNADRLESEFGAQVDSLVDLAEQLSFRPVVVTIPFRTEVFPNRLRDSVERAGLGAADVDPDQPDRILTRAFAARGVPVVSILECLRAHRTDDIHYPEDTHFNAAGHRLAAACLAPRLRPLLADSLPIRP